MWFSLTEEAKMPTQRQLMAALDAALSAQVNLLFSKMASAASGADPAGRFAAGIKNASFFYDKAADIIRNTVQERQAALAQPRQGDDKLGNLEVNGASLLPPLASSPG